MFLNREGTNVIELDFHIDNAKLLPNRELIIGTGQAMIRRSANHRC